MDNGEIRKMIGELKGKKIDMFGKDFFLTWEKSRDELEATFIMANALRAMRAANISTKIWESGIAVSNFRDNSTRTRFSYASACDLLGLYVQDLDEGKSQIAHGETVRETANMISFLTEAIGIRDDMYLGEGDSYQREVAASLDEGVKAGVLPNRPAVINLQSDIDHPTQAMADFLHLANRSGGLDKLRGKKIAMTWAYSPSYGKPLSVPQGIIGLATRLGMEVSLAHPEGYDLIPEVVEMAKKQATASGGSFTQTNSMDEAFRNADIVYPKSWAPFNVMQQRVPLLHANDQAGLKDLERKCLENNARFMDWECTEAKMMLTRNSGPSAPQALYMHCLPADITGVSCKAGEVAASVFDRYRDETYMEASYKPYIIAAMILLCRSRDPSALLQRLLDRAIPRSAL
jgi:knotted carbamoyltransferase YgeW